MARRSRLTMALIFLIVPAGAMMLTAWLGGYFVDQKPSSRNENIEWAKISRAQLLSEFRLAYGCKDVQSFGSAALEMGYRRVFDEASQQDIEDMLGDPGLITSMYANPDYVEKGYPFERSVVERAPCMIYQIDEGSGRLLLLAIVVKNDRVLYTSYEHTEDFGKTEITMALVKYDED